jgi:hypothetical protein
MVKNQFIPLDKLRQIKHNRVRWSNFLINAAIDCSALEKRALYLISAWVKENFVVKNLGVPDNWKKTLHANDRRGLRLYRRKEECSPHL